MHQPQLGLETGGDLAHARFQLARRGQQPAPFLEHLLARRRQRGARPVAREQRQPELVFELGDRIGNRRRHLVQPLRSGGKRAVTRNRVDDFHGFKR
ncbi:hypothetical protein D3C71_1724000 [compost metagenome]